MKERKTNKMSKFLFMLQNGSKFIPWFESSHFKGEVGGCVKMEKKPCQEGGWKEDYSCECQSVHEVNEYEYTTKSKTTKPT